MKQIKCLLSRFLIVLLSIGSLTLAKTDVIVSATSLTVKETVWVNGSNVNVREEPNTKSKSLGKVNSGTSLDLYEKRDDGWSCINFNGSSAYIKSEFLSDKEIQPVTATKSKKSSSGGKKSSAKTSNTNTTDVAASSTPIGETVYITDGGKCYHKTSTCSNMKNPVATTLDNAVAIGKKPCKKCY